MTQEEVKAKMQEGLDKVEPKFKVGDWVVLSTSDGEKVVQIDSVEYFKSGEPRYITSEGRWFGNGTKVHLWTIQDAKDGDILVNGNSILIFKRFEENRVYRHCSLYIDNSTNHFSHTYNTFTPATKEQRDLFFQKIKESGYEWDSEKKELRIVQKPKWSDDDEQYLLVCKNALRKYQVSDKWDADIISKWLEDKLKQGKQGEKTSKWTKEDECYMGECISAIATKDGWSFEEKRKTKHWLNSIKQRIGE